MLIKKYRIKLEVRIKTILRRLNKSIELENRQKAEVFTLNVEKKEIKKNNIPLNFTLAEYQIMSLFCERKSSIVSRYDILQNSTFLDSDSDGASIAVLINRIRAKIEENPKKPTYLLTIRGMGYKLTE